MDVMGMKDGDCFSQLETQHLYMARVLGKVVMKRNDLVSSIDANLDRIELTMA